MISDMIENKRKNLINPKKNNFSSQLKSILGKSTSDIEIENLIKKNDDDFSNLIKNKFKLKKEERINFLGKNESSEIEKRIFLQLMDQNWKMHIQYLEQLRGVIGLRSYGQRDPLIEYKKEAFSLFENLLNKLKTDFLTILFNLKIVNQNESVKNQKEISEKNFKKIANKKVGRNEPCPCNSGKKFKYCCGAL